MGKGYTRKPRILVPTSNLDSTVHALLTSLNINGWTTNYYVMLCLEIHFTVPATIMYPRITTKVTKW